jgi:hypothetical protein
MKNLRSTLFYLSFLLFAFNGSVLLAETKTVGSTGADYSSLKVAFDAINAGSITGDITLQVIANTTEPASAVLFANGYLTANYSSVLIYPTLSGLSVTAQNIINGGINGPLLDFSGADNVTIDGRVNATGSTIGLTITNGYTSNGSTAGTIRFINDASANTIQYCTLTGATYSLSSGIVSFSTTTETSGNDNNTISNNLFTGRVKNAIYAMGTIGKPNDGIVVSNNKFYNTFSLSQNSAGIIVAAGNTAWTITGNSFYDDGSPGFTATSYTYVGIANSEGSGFTITGNYFGGSGPNCSGMMSASTTGALIISFIILNVPAVGTPSSVQNNTIRNISWSSTNTTTIYGINVLGGTVNIGNTTGNTIGGADAPSLLSFSSSTGVGTFTGMRFIGTSVINCQNNTIGGIALANTNNSFNFTGIDATNSGGSTISSNLVGSEAITQSVSTPASTTAQTVYGIRVKSTAAGPITLSGNTIANISNGSTAAAGVASFIDGISVEANTALTVTGNTIHDLTIPCSNNQTGPSSSVIGIVYATGLTAQQTITGNSIHTIGNTNTTAVAFVYGIYFNGSSSLASTIASNFVANLTNASTNTSASIYGLRLVTGSSYCYNNIIAIYNTTVVPVYGISESGLASNNSSLYFNTVYIGGSVASTTARSYCLYSTGNANTRDFRNNVLWNARSTTSGTNLNFAIYLNYNSTTGLTMDYNDLYANGTGGALGWYNGASVNSVPIIAGFDTHDQSLNPQFINPGGILATDYKVASGISGTNVGIATDYGNVTRTVYTMGAWECNNVELWNGGFVGGYATLKAAFDAINSGAATGALTIKIKTNTTETASAVLNTSGSGSASYSSLTIYPSAAGLTVTGSLAAPLIDLNGADNVTIDGRLNATGTTADLTINNTSTASTAGTSTIRFINDATSNIVKYCSVKGSTTSTTSGVLFFSSTTGTTGNDNNTIEYNNLTAASNSNRPVNMVYSTGTAAKDNDGLNFSSNNVFDFLNGANSSNGIYLGDNTTTCTISGNSFYETDAPFTSTTANTYTAININNTSGNGFVVSGNYIGGNAALCSGIWSEAGTPAATFKGINIAAGTGTASSVQNNTIKGFSWSNTGQVNFTAIANSSGAINIGTATGNTIGAATGNGSITLTSGSDASTCYGIWIDNSSGAAVNCLNNIIGAITTACTDPTMANNIYAIYAKASGACDISSNAIGSSATTNSLYTTSASTFYKQSLYGIYSEGSGTITINNNTIKYLTNGTTSVHLADPVNFTGEVKGIFVVGQTVGIHGNTLAYFSNGDGGEPIGDSPASVEGISVWGPGATATITGNTIHDLVNTNDGFRGFNDGIFIYDPSSNPQIISGNFIYNIYNAVLAQACTANGVFLFCENATVSNNIVKLGSDRDDSQVLYGIWYWGGEYLACYSNTISIEGNSSMQSVSYGLELNITNLSTVIFENNIISNTRSSVPAPYITWGNFCISVQGSEAASSINLDYNDYYRSGTNGAVACIGPAWVWINSLPLLPGKDAHSKIHNPGFANPGGTLATDYKPFASVVGVSGTGVTTDYLGATRGTPPVMGAFESFDIWTGAQSNDWNTNGNWAKNTVPSTTNDAVINSAPNNPLISGNATLSRLIIDDGGSLSVNYNGSLTVNSTLTNNTGTSALTIKSTAEGTGSLLHSTAGVNGTVQRYISGNEYDWHQISSPNENTEILIGSSTFVWYEPLQQWVSRDNTNVYPSFTEANGGISAYRPGYGYMAAYPFAFDEPTQSYTNQTLSFSGPLNQGDIGAALDKKAAAPASYEGFNLLGNPYPSSIDWKAVSGWSNRDQLVNSGGGYNFWVWSDQNNNYGAYNSASVSDDGTLGLSRYIAPMQAYWVEAANDGGTITVGNAARVNSNQNWLKSGSVHGSIRLMAGSADDEGRDELLIETGHEANSGGARKMFSMVPTAPSLYSPKDAIGYSISFLTTVEENPLVPVNFLAGKDGLHYISLGTAAGFDYLVLEDKKTGIFTDLLADAVYTFEASTNDAADRFILHLKNVLAVNENVQDQQPVIWYSKGNIEVYNPWTEAAQMQVYNLAGQSLGAVLCTPGHSSNSYNLKPGVYVVRLMNEQKASSIKIVIN